MLESHPESKPTTVRQALHATVAALYELTTPLPAEEPLRAALRRESLEAVRYAEHAALEPKDIVFFAASLGTLIAYCQLASLEYNPEFAGLVSTLSQIRDSLGAKTALSTPPTKPGETTPSRRQKAPRSKKAGSPREQGPRTRTAGRHQQILEMVKERPTVQLAEIIEHFPGTSGRTLRRDLEVLASLGFLHREGSTSDVSYRVDTEKVKTVFPEQDS